MREASTAEFTGVVIFYIEKSKLEVIIFRKQVLKRRLFFGHAYVMNVRLTSSFLRFAVLGLK